MVRVFVMTAVVGAPGQRMVLKRRCTKNQREQFNRPLGLKRLVRKQAVIAERDAQTSRDEEDQKHRRLEPVYTDLPEVNRHSGDRDQSGSDKERTIGPIDSGIR